MKRIFTLLCAALFAVVASAQMPQLPIDPEVKVGVLENGMTYFIRHNDKPENRAEFYLATHVGAVQEAPDQDGLAHFLEHMCFNGTKNFPGKSLLNYLEGIGASFGGNINAATGFEQTTYMLNNIPLVREGVIDTCLLIMHDYSHFVTCDPVEIDAERGVIMEEKRTRNTASWRNNVSSRKYIFKGSPLAETSLIGSYEQLESFKPESLTNFYQTWYRPDLQALIVVGDVDVEAIEAKIIATFADIPAVEDPQPKIPNVVPDNVEPIIGITSDPENTRTSVDMIWKSEPLPAEMCNTAVGMLTDLCKYLISHAMNERLSAIAASDNAPFLSAGFGIQSLCESCEATLGEVVVRDGDAINGTAALYTELIRMSKYGFSDDEYERGKAELLSSLESAAAKAGTRKNAEFVQPIINFFFHNEPMMDPQTELEVAKQLMTMVSGPQLNQMVQQLITKENLVIVYSAPEKEGLVHPTEEAFLQMMAAVEASDIEALQQEEIAKEFMNPAKLKGAKKTAERSGLHGETVWTLSNGLEVVLVPSELEKDKITVSLSKDGGLSLIDEKDIASFDSDILTLYTMYTGVAGFSATQVEKMLAGKKVAAEPFISDYESGVSASATPKDFETALQLVYLYYTQPRFDPSEYNKGIAQIEAVLPNMLSNADYRFQRTLYNTIYGNNPRRRVLDDEVLAKASLKTLQKGYKKLFKDVAGAKVYITGDFQPAEIEPMVLKYLGSLPKGKKATAYVDHNSGIVDGTVMVESAEKMEQSKVRAMMFYKINDKEYSYEKQAACEALSYILDMVYVETLRESEGGTYGASTNARIQRRPKVTGLLQIAFETNMESKDKLIALAKDGLENIAKNGPTEEQFSKTIKNMAKNLPESRIRNAYWTNAAQTWMRYGEDSDALTEAAINALSAEKVKEIAAEFVNSGNYIQVVLVPELQ